MADIENSVSSKVVINKGDSIEIHGLSQKLTKVEENGATNGATNGVDLHEENNLCLYHTNKQSDIELSANVTEFHRNETNGNSFQCEPEKTELLDVEAAENQINKTESVEKAVSLPEENSSQQKEPKPRIETIGKSCKSTETDFSEFDSYNHICTEVQAKESVDEDFHKASKQMFRNIDEELTGTNNQLFYSVIFVNVQIMFFALQVLLFGSNLHRIRFI